MKRRVSHAIPVAVLPCVLLMCLSAPALPQSAFNRNDNHDFRSLHYLSARGSNPDNFGIFIASDSHFRFFKLHVARPHLTLHVNAVCYRYRIDMNNDGNWEQNWTTADETVVSYHYPNPPDGISANHTIKVEYEFYYWPTRDYTRKETFHQITIFSTPRVYVNSENDAFIQLRNQDAPARIPVLMVEGFDGQWLP